MWVTTTDLPTAASHPFYRRLNQLLREHGFDDFAEAQSPASMRRRWAGRDCRRRSIFGCCYAKLYLRILRPNWAALVPADEGLSRSLRAVLVQLDVEIQKLHEEAALAA